MAWYRAGTIALTNGSQLVTGTGTSWISSVRVGYALIGPDGRSYEIVDIASNTSLTLAAGYLGATSSGQPYAIMPTSSLAGDLAVQASGLIASFAGVRDGIGQGLIPNGTVSLPALRFDSAQSSGLYRAIGFGIGLSVEGVPVLMAGPGLTRIGNANQFTDVGVNNGSGYIASSAGNLNLMTAGGQSFVFTIGSTATLAVSATSLYALTDNSIALGLASRRYTVLYASTGTINTSDAREKDWRGPLSEAELRAARTIARGIGAYRWLASIQEKGDDARLHVGVKAQDVIAALEAEGLPAMDYGFVCYDSWAAQPAVPEMPGSPATPEIRDAAGAIVSPAMPAGPPMPGRPALAAGDRYGIRPDELCLFLAAAQEQRLAALEAAAL